MSCPIQMQKCREEGISSLTPSQPPPNPKCAVSIIIPTLKFGFGGGARRAVGVKACAVQVFPAREEELPNRDAEV